MDTVESRVKGLEDRMERVYKILEGNGKPGLIKEFGDHRNAFDQFIAVWKNREEDKMRYDDRQEKERIEQKKSFNARMNILIGIAGLIFLMVGTVVAVLTYERTTGHAILSPKLDSDIYDSASFQRYDSNRF